MTPGEYIENNMGQRARGAWQSKIDGEIVPLWVNRLDKHKDRQTNVLFQLVHRDKRKD